MMNDEDLWHCCTRYKQNPCHVWTAGVPCSCAKTTWNMSWKAVSLIMGSFPSVEKWYKAFVVVLHSLEEIRNKACLWKEMCLRETLCRCQAEVHWPRLGKVASGQVQLSAGGGPSIGRREGECPRLPVASPQGPHCQQCQPGPGVPTYSTFINMYFYGWEQNFTPVFVSPDA